MDFLPTDCFVLEDEEAADWFLSSSSSSCYVPFCAEAGATTLKICSGSSSIARTVACTPGAKASASSSLPSSLVDPSLFH